MPRFRCGSEYHLGLAAAMNVPVSTYLDTRMAVNLFGALPDAQKKTIGAKLLNHAIETNPFNPAPWYLLARQAGSPEEGMALTRRVQGNLTNSPEAAKNDVNATLEDILEAKARQGRTGADPAILADAGGVHGAIQHPGASNAKGPRGGSRHIRLPQDRSRHHAR